MRDPNSSRFLQIVMIENTAIDDRYADAGSIKPILLPGNISLYRWNIVIGSHFVRTVRADVGNIRMVLQPRQHSYRYPIRRAIDAIERKFQLSATSRHISKAAPWASG